MSASTPLRRCLESMKHGRGTKSRAAGSGDDRRRRTRCLRSLYESTSGRATAERRHGERGPGNRRSDSEKNLRSPFLSTGYRFRPPVSAVCTESQAEVEERPLERDTRARGCRPWNPNRGRGRAMACGGTSLLPRPEGCDCDRTGKARRQVTADESAV